MGIFSFLQSHKKTRSPYPLPKVPDELRGFTNIGVYEVHGVNPKTGRKNKKEVYGLDDEAARNGALAAGLVDPIQTCEVRRLRPTVDQIKALRKAGYYMFLSDNLTHVDASALISYERDGDRRRITQEEWDAACAAGYEISALSGPTLFEIVMRTGDWRRYDE